MMKPVFSYRRLKQRGNVMLALFAAIGMVGAVGAVSMGVMKGPVRGMNTINERTTTETGILSATKLIANASIALPIETADCDEDGYIEPLAYKPAGTNPAPAGGGNIPDGVGARKADAWSTLYGYCVWDPGEKSVRDSVAACGGAGAGRLNGSGAEEAAGVAIAVISAGPDGVFQSSCNDWVNDTTPIINTPSNSDDVIRTMAYAEFMVSGQGDAKLKEMPDEACTPQSVGIMRLYLGIVQVCVDTGWEEVGTSAQADTNFVPVTNAALGSQHTSNEITFTGFLNTKTITVTGSATLRVNGVVRAAPATIVSGDKVSLRANASGTPEVTNTYTVSVSGIQRSWTVRTRDYYPASLSISPSSVSGMNVQGPAEPSTGALVGFVVTNIGETVTAEMEASVLSNPTNFENFVFSGIGDGCVGQVLSPGGTCPIQVRPRATGAHDQSTISGSLTVTDGAESATATPLTGFAKGWTCLSPWSGPRINHTASVTAYATATVAYNATCTSQIRTCTADVLSGTYMHQTCAPVAALTCARPWGGTVAHGAGVTAYQTASVAYNATCASQTRTCTNGNLSGSYTHQSCAPVAALNCTLPWGGTLAHGGSVTAYASANVGFGGSCVGQTRTCTNGSLSGSYTAQTCTVAAPTYSYGAWSGFGSCSATCGGGTQTRTRSCLRQDGVVSACSNCGGVCSENASCNTQTCCVTEGPYFTQWTYVWNHGGGGEQYSGGYYGGASIGWGPQGVTSVQQGGWTYHRGTYQMGPYYYSIYRTNCP